MRPAGAFLARPIGSRARRLVLAALLFTLLGPARATAQDQPRRPWKPADPAPTLAGIHLGDSRSRLDSLLGPPSSEEDTGEEVDGTPVVELGYESTGLTIQYAPAHGVRLVIGSAAGTALGGIRVGDLAADVVKRWGEPDTGGLGALLYQFGPWTVIVQADDSGRVALLAVGVAPEEDE